MQSKTAGSGNSHIRADVSKELSIGGIGEEFIS